MNYKVLAARFGMAIALLLELIGLGRMYGDMLNPGPGFILAVVAAVVCLGGALAAKTVIEK